MEDTEVNYENVRNIPIKLFDGTIVEKKRVEIETKHVFSTTIRKEKKQIDDEKTTDQKENEEANTNETKDSSCQNIPIKINFIGGTSNTSPRFRSTKTSTQNSSLSSSIPSLAEVSRKTQGPKKNLGHPPTLSGQKTLDEIQNDLEDAQKKLAKHREQIGSTSVTALSSRERNIENRSRSVETSSRMREMKKIEEPENKRAESSVDLEKYMEVWRNISRDLDEIIKNANVDTRNSDLTRNSSIALRAKSVPPNEGHKMKTKTKIIGKKDEEAAKPNIPKKNIYLTEIPSQSLQQNNHKDMTTSTDSLDIKVPEYKGEYNNVVTQACYFSGAKGLRNMLQERGHESLKNGETNDKLSPKPPKRDIRSKFFCKENPKTIVTNGPDTNADVKDEVDKVILPTEAACHACDACTQTGDGRNEKEKGCSVM